MNLRTFSIGNFKSFGPIPQDIPLKPITLIFGPNSAGKSSVLHSLLWLKHFLTTGDADFRHPMGQQAIDFGGFKNLIHGGETNRRMLFSHSFNPRAFNYGIPRWFEIREQWKLDFSVGIPSSGGFEEPAILDYLITIDGQEFFKAVRKRNGRLTATHLDCFHPALAPILGSLGNLGLDTNAGKSHDEDPRVACLQTIVGAHFREEGLHLNAAKSFPDELAYTDDENFEFSDEDFKSSKFFGTAEGERLREVVFEQLFKSLEDLVATTAKIFTNNYGELGYIPPLREVPQRLYDLKTTQPIWRRLFEIPGLLEKVNGWLGSEHLQNRYQLEAAEFYPRKQLLDELPVAMQNEFSRVILSHGDVGDVFEEADCDSIRAKAIETFFQQDLEALYQKHAPEELEAFWDERVNDIEEGLLEYTDEDEYPWNSLSAKRKLRWTKNNLGISIEDYLYGELGNWSSERVFELWLREYTAPDELRVIFEQYGDQKEAAERLLEKLSSSDSIRREISLRPLGSNLNLSLQDVGIGISQVLPVLLETYGRQYTRIAIEQPELHIHPALQSELGDLFIESALGQNKNTFLLETHSEHLILRILRRIRETTREKLPEGKVPITPDDVAVLYVSPGENGAVIKNLRITEQGRFRDDWPNGFFEERFNEEF